jgi:hypothetical protein
LGFAAESQYIREEMPGYTGPKHMRELWTRLVGEDQELAGDGWAIAARWVIHKHLPGAMSFESAWGDTSNTSPTWTRFDPRAKKIAARVAGRVLPFLVGDDRQIYEPGLRLLLRLGLAGRLLPKALRRSIADCLLSIAPLRLSAAVLLAHVYRKDLEKSQLQRLVEIFLKCPAPDSPSWPLRHALGLVWLDCDLSLSTVTQIEETFNSTPREKFESSGFGISGRLADMSDPFVYPWAHSSIYAASGILRARRAKFSHDARRDALNLLIDSCEMHPGVAALLSGNPGLDRSTKFRVDSALARWTAVGALNVGRFDLDLTAPSRARPTSKRSQQKRKR